MNDVAFYCESEVMLLTWFFHLATGKMCSKYIMDLIAVHTLVSFLNAFCFVI